MAVNVHFGRVDMRHPCINRCLQCGNFIWITFWYRATFISAEPKGPKAKDWEGETIDEISTRTGNVLKPDFIALINDIDEDTKLSKGQLLKIGIVEQYIPGN